VLTVLSFWIGLATFALRMSQIGPQSFVRWGWALALVVWFVAYYPAPAEYSKQVELECEYGRFLANFGHSAHLYRQWQVRRGMGMIGVLLALLVF
jgi:hypothetical protein